MQVQIYLGIRASARHAHARSVACGTKSVQRGCCAAVLLSVAGPRCARDSLAFQKCRPWVRTWAIRRRGKAALRARSA